MGQVGRKETEDREKLRREGGIEGTCMRGGLKKKGEERGSIHVVACGQELEYSENLGASCNMVACVPYSEYCTLR